MFRACLAGWCLKLLVEATVAASAEASAGTSFVDDAAINPATAIHLKTFKARANPVRSVALADGPRTYHTTSPRAALFTNNTLVSFDYAHLVLATLAALQCNGYAVDAVVQQGQPARSVIQYAEMADGHGFAVDANQLYVVKGVISGSRIYTGRGYDVFVAMGDEPLPRIMGAGKLNIYVCTSLPTQESADFGQLFTLPSYDVIAFTSKEARDRQIATMEAYSIAAVRDRAPIPDAHVLTVPHGSGRSQREENGRNHIVLPGHALTPSWRATQKSAITAFAGSRDRRPPSTRLAVFCGSDDCAMDLKMHAGGSPVDVVTDVSADNHVRMLSSARVVWMLRADGDKCDRAEDRAGDDTYVVLGGLMATAMKLGVVPIVHEQTLAKTITDGRDGYAVSSLDQLVNTTARVFGMVPEKARALADAVSSSVSTRSFDDFSQNLDTTLKRAASSRPWRQAVTVSYADAPSLRFASASRRACVCIETRHHYALRWSVLNIAHHAPDWSMTVFHGKQNQAFVEGVLVDVGGVRLRPTPHEVADGNDYHHLLSSVDFWLSLEADTVFLFGSGTVLTGSLDALVADAGVWTLEDRNASALDHPAGLFNIRQTIASLKSGHHGHRSSQPCSVVATRACDAASASNATIISPTLGLANQTDALALLNRASRRSPFNTSTISYAGYRPSSLAPKTAAVYTPYPILFGGGESYLLQSVASLQSFGYTVDIIVHPNNPTRTVDDVLRVARGLRVAVQPANLRLLHIPHVGSALTSIPTNYGVFFLMGNEKAPLLRGIGAVNFYMCQFPFDLSAPLLPARVRTLASYDYVVVNSRFTYTHYSRVASSLFSAMVDADMLVPQVAILHPPVQHFVQTGLPTHKRHIILLGRIFMDRYNKGHHLAIAAFKALQGHIPADVRLLLVGNLMPTHDAYLDMLRRKAAGLKVDIVVSPPPDKVRDLLQSSLVQWHLTGADSVVNDPASQEHFGMSIVEGMSVGCVPVVLRKGGAVDIVDDGVNGLLADGIDDVVAKTRRVYGMRADQLANMTSAAKAKAASFAPAEFNRQFEDMVYRALKSRIFKHAIKQAAPILRQRAPLAVAPSSNNTAVLVEARQHYALRFCALNVMTHLPALSWGLHVFHGATNGRFARSVLADVDGVRYTRMPYGVLTIPQYNDLLKSRSFWSALHTDNVLLFQTDSVLLGRNVGDFVGRYDYVGAPWHVGNERMSDELPGGVGNGGLSLRTTASALDIIRQHGAASNSSEQEDVFFARHMGGFRLAPRQTAYAFSLEVPNADLNAVDTPFALHGAWYYNDEWRMAYLLEYVV